MYVLIVSHSYSLFVFLPPIYVRYVYRRLGLSEDQLKQLNFLLRREVMAKVSDDLNVIIDPVAAKEQEEAAVAAAAAAAAVNGGASGAGGAGMGAIGVIGGGGGGGVRTWKDVLRGVQLEQGGGGASKTVDDIEEGTVVGLYFSAWWCGPCGAFTPKLVKLYKTMKEEAKAGNVRKKFEVIYVGDGQDPAKSNDYFRKMPWLGVPASSKANRALSDMFGVQGYPTLVFVDEQGAVISSDGRTEVSKDPKGKGFPWTAEALAEGGGGGDNDEALTDGERRCIRFACEQLALASVKESHRGRLGLSGLRSVKQQIECVEGQLAQIPMTVADASEPPTQLQLFADVPVVPHRGFDLQLRTGTRKYLGNESERASAAPADILEVPEAVYSVEGGVAALTTCSRVCANLLKRAKDSASSSRMVLQYEVIQLIAHLFTEVLPPPVPPEWVSPAAAAAAKAEAKAEAAAVDAVVDRLRTLKTLQLRKECRQRELVTTGDKDELLQRLILHIRPHKPASVLAAEADGGSVGEGQGGRELSHLPGGEDESMKLAMKLSVASAASEQQLQQGSGQTGSNDPKETGEAPLNYGWGALHHGMYAHVADMLGLQLERGIHNTVHMVWTCDECETENHGILLKCHMCAKVRPLPLSTVEASVVGESSTQERDQERGTFGAEMKGDLMNASAAPTAGTAAFACALASEAKEESGSVAPRWLGSGWGSLHDCMYPLVAQQLGLTLEPSAVNAGTWTCSECEEACHGLFRECFMCAAPAPPLLVPSPQRAAQDPQATAQAIAQAGPGGQREQLDVVEMMVTMALDELQTEAGMDPTAARLALLMAIQMTGDISASQALEVRVRPFVISFFITVVLWSAPSSY